MRQLFVITTLIALATLSLQAVTPNQIEQADTTTTRSYTTEEIVIRSSTKETNNLWRIPGAVSLLTPYTINSRGIESVKDLSVMVPNLFIPDYGSRMTTPIYLRGIGTRSSGQAIGFYLDDIPYMDKSTFDFDLLDIQRIEVLRGPQGTLYGRNAMGGIINVYTLSPFDFQGTKISLGAGNFGSYNGRISHYAKLGEKVGLSVSGYYDHRDGFFTNQYTQEKADDEQSAGGKLKLEWKVNPRLTAKLYSSFDHTYQGAFPYGLYDKDNDVTAGVNFNDRATYLRNMTNNSLRLEYRTDKFLLSSNTGYQYLNDDMWMDQDFTPLSVFTINQRQKQHSVNEEITIKSLGTSNYQWSVGTFGFFNSLHTTGDVKFKEDGIRNILQPVFDNMMPPTVPVHIKIADTEIPNPGKYKTPSYGVALFHQSTFNNLLTKGLSATLGVRLDYEKQSLKYNTSMAMNTIIESPMFPRPIPYEIDKTLSGTSDQDFFQVLPKISLKYECTPDIMTYATVSKGYKAGGYNIQMFSEVMQDSLKNSRPAIPTGRSVDTRGDQTADNDIRNALAYKPEETWNYELGTRANLLDGALSGELSVFYMDIKNVQLTQFVNGGSGRILTNAGKGRSYGAEFSLNARVISGLFLDFNYGYTHATFTKYEAGTDKQGNVINYKGKFIPYTPGHTFSAGANYSLMLPGKWVNQMTFGVNYTGAGKIYWTENNDLNQKFYGTLNAKIGARHDFVKLEFWARNILETKYNAFYFESFGQSFMQRGNPFTCGVNLAFVF